MSIRLWLGRSTAAGDCARCSKRPANLSSAPASRAASANGDGVAPAGLRERNRRLNVCQRLPARRPTSALPLRSGDGRPMFLARLSDFACRPAKRGSSTGPVTMWRNMERVKHDDLRFTEIGEGWERCGARRHFRGVHPLIEWSHFAPIEERVRQRGGAHRHWAADRRPTKK